MDDKDKKSTTEESVPPPKTTDTETPEQEADPLGRDPTRFGDWEKDGRCIDF
ncbi:MAG: DUF1674 domain-containing protein [Rhodospirillales bacterium]|jgi:hypothetical protein|nr:DUF1674 domain-containing protein [Rhodospirillales bacterium]MBT4039716.1 DUF1674 domain-containing protein [Rhodospirillales bacterium]MBT4626167.1 DUF1674 domain-containing protein [Rhodospirillales bacterium]MBT5350269.1 DUF1674 domain-containing protein [Rhodospirillales bacterium]MBT5522307.1 DUF1674 domain-containing protein [Rhodospirillales bacterium]